MDKVTLLPCPFCNGPAVNVAGEYITCGAPVFIDCAGRTIRTDITAWNTRATPAPDSEKLREAQLRRALANTSAIVRLQNGNLHEDINKILAEADTALGASS